MSPDTSLSLSSRRLVAIVAAKVTVLVLVTWYRRHKDRQAAAAEQHEGEEYKRLRAKVPPQSIMEFERAAKLGALAKVYFQYFSEEAVTAAACRAAFQAIRLVPRILQGDLSHVDTRIELFGEVLEMPVLIAPTAFHVLACSEGEIATARGAGKAGAGYCYNFMLSSKDYRQVISQKGAKWLHLYMFEERDLVQASLQAAEATGAFSAVILTCDHPHTRVQGRMMPYFTQATMPHANPDDLFFPNQAAIGFGDITLRQLNDPNIQFDRPPGGTNSAKLSWDDVKWIRSLTKLPVVAKGILSADDARAALDAGVDAIVVSNHGGRQCDFAVPAVQALPTVVRAVQGRVPVLVDSGVRTAADVVRARCLGATAVLLGRPPLWALACEGSTGLERMLTTLRQDLQDDLRSLGVTSIHDLGMENIWPPDRQRIEETVKLCT